VIIDEVMSTEAYKTTELNTYRVQRVGNTVTEPEKLEEVFLTVVFQKIFYASLFF